MLGEYDPTPKILCKMNYPSARKSICYLKEATYYIVNILFFLPSIVEVILFGCIFLIEISFAFSCGRSLNMRLFELVSMEKYFLVAFLEFLSFHSSAAVLDVPFR